MPNPDFQPPEQGSFEAGLDYASLAKDPQVQKKLEQLKAQAEDKARQADLSKIQSDIEQTADLLSVRQSLDALTTNLGIINKEILQAERSRNFEKVASLYEERAEEERELKAWLDHEKRLQGQLKEARVATLREKVRRDLTADAKKLAERKETIQGENEKDAMAELMEDNTDLLSEHRLSDYDRPQYVAKRVEEAEEILEPAKEIPFILEESKEPEIIPGVEDVEKTELSPEIPSPARAHAFEQTDQEVEVAPVAPPKKSWKIWGARALAFVGLGGLVATVAPDVAKQLQNLDQLSAQAQQGVKDSVESSPYVRTGVTKENAERLVAGEAVDMGTGSVRIAPETPEDPTTKKIHRAAPAPSGSTEGAFQALHEYGNMMEPNNENGWSGKPSLTETITREEALDDNLSGALKTLENVPGDRSEAFEKAYRNYTGQREDSKMKLRQGLVDQLDAQKMGAARKTFIDELRKEADLDPQMKPAEKKVVQALRNLNS